MVHPGQARGHLGDDLPGVGGAPSRQLSGRDPLASLVAEQNELVVVADRRAGDVGDVDHRRVHRHVAHDRDTHAAYERLASVRERPGVSIAIPEGQGGDATWARGRERGAVTDAVADRQVHHPDRSGAQRHHRSERAHGQGGEMRTVELVGNQAIDRKTRAHAIKRREARKQAGARGQMSGR